MSRSIKNTSEELRRKNLEHEKNHYKGKELTDLNPGENNDQYIRRVDTNCAYFVKMGCCRYGSLCRFIHPEKKTVWNPLKTSQDFGAEHSSLDFQRQILLLGSSKAEASGQVYCLSPADCMCGNTCQFAHHQNKVDVGLNKSRSADSPVLSKGGIPIHVPYRIPFPEKFTISVGPTGLPLRTGRSVCKYYSHFGLCKYGIGCQDDHPTDFKSVAVPVPQRLFKSRNHHK